MEVYILKVCIFTILYLLINYINQHISDDVDVFTENDLINMFFEYLVLYKLYKSCFRLHLIIYSCVSILALTKVSSRLTASFFITLSNNCELSKIYNKPSIILDKYKVFLMKKILIYKLLEDIFTFINAVSVSVMVLSYSFLTAILFAKVSFKCVSLHDIFSISCCNLFFSFS